MTDYLVFARKYRPQQFSDLRGQDALVKTLSSAIENDRMPHAVILTGVRGVGKTTTARLIARALNCVGQDGQGGATITPCGVCPPCRDILADHHLDVIEMDAASRTGIDDIRTIIEATAYKPTSARFKVYIIDEVHMLSKSAFNALLKTLEEPPARVIFIFATTEIQKVPDTIISRCMRFDLKRIDVSDLQNLFTTIADKEGFSIEPAALTMLAKCADGSARDGLSLLERARALSSDNTITQTIVQEMLGVAENIQVLIVFQAILSGDSVRALESFRVFHQAGGNPLSFLVSLAEFMHHGTCALIDDSYLNTTMLTTQDQQLLLDALNNVNIPTLSRLWQSLITGLTEVKHCPLVTIGSEMLLVRLCYLGTLPKTQDLVKAFKNGIFQEPTSTQKTIPIVSNTQDNENVVENATTNAAITDVTSGETKVPNTPSSFEDVIELFDLHKEPLLRHILMTQVRPLTFDPHKCTFEWHLDADVPSDFSFKVQKCLNAWTQKNWMIVQLTESPKGAMTYQEKKERQHQEVVQTVQQDLIVQEIIKTFPDSEIRDISPLKSEIRDISPLKQAS